jgi:hypothetical protein
VFLSSWGLAAWSAFLEGRNFRGDTLGWGLECDGDCQPSFGSFRGPDLLLSGRLFAICSLGNWTGGGWPGLIPSGRGATFASSANDMPNRRTKDHEPAAPDNSRRTAHQDGGHEVYALGELHLEGFKSWRGGPASVGGLVTNPSTRLSADQDRSDRDARVAMGALRSHQWKFIW